MKEFLLDFRGPMGLETYFPIYLHSIFEILQFEISSLMNISNWNFTGYSSQKNPVQTRKKISIFQTGELQKSSADR
jgi:hypothetical protein